MGCKCKLLLSYKQEGIDGIGTLVGTSDATMTMWFLGMSSGSCLMKHQ